MWEISTVAWIMEMTIISKNYANIFFLSLFVNWVQQALSKFLFVFMFFSLVLAVTNEPPPVLQSSFCVKTLIIFLSNNNTGPRCTGHQQHCSHLQRSWYRWMRSVIWVKTRQAMESSVNICRTWPTSPIVEHRHQPDQDCSTSHSSVTTILKFFYSAWIWASELLSVLIIPCTYGNIAYIDINCKNNRQMPAAWKVWRIGVKIPFVFALPAPSQCPHTLCISSPQLSSPASDRKTEELQQGLSRTDSRATLLFLKLGEFFPPALIGILMISAKPREQSRVARSLFRKSIN